MDARGSRRRSLVTAVSVGPLAVYEELVRRELTRVGYAPSTVDEVVRAIARLSLWMRQHQVSVEELTPQMVEQFLAARREGGRSQHAARRGTGAALKVLRAAGVAPAAEVIDDSPAASVLAGFRTYLVVERGVSDATVRSYTGQAKKFLLALPEPLLETLGRLDTAMVTSFMVRETVAAASVETAKALVTAMRSLLRYLHVAGLVPVSLAGAVPRVPGWRLSSLPRGLEPEQVQRLLGTATAHRETPAGLRDYAVLVMMVRLGLRGGEVAALMLADVDWRAGQILVRGKGSRVERLPMPRAVGEAVVAYLTGGRPACSRRELFVTARAPYQAMSQEVVTEIMASGCRRAGLPRLGAHRLRHTLACQLLRAGGSLAEIGQVLRHRTHLATAIYAKVDHEALRTLARPWPVSAR